MNNYGMDAPTSCCYIWQLLLYRLVKRVSVHQVLLKNTLHATELSLDLVSGSGTLEGRG